MHRSNLIGSAQRLGEPKLIPVKVEHLTYKDLPPPFDVLHTEDVGQDNKIRAAVVAQLAKPEVEPTAWAVLTKGFKYELLTWWGIIGGAVTLFSAYSATVTLAPWARKLVENWTEWTHAFWVWVFGWLGIQLPPEWTPILSFLLFGSLLAIGEAVKFNRAVKTQTIGDKYEDKSFQLTSWRTILCLVVTVPFASWWATCPFGLIGYGLISKYIDVGGVFVSLHGILPPLVLVIVFARARLHAAVAIFLMAILWIISTYNPFSKYSALAVLHALAARQPPPYFSWVVAFTMMPVVSVFLLSVAPAKAVTRRLIFLALGLLLLIALNELSKLGLDVTAPKLQG